MSSTWDFLLGLAKLLLCLEHLHPAASKALGKAFDAALEKNLPHPSCQGSSNFRLHSLSSRVSVALAAPKFRALIHLRSLNRATFGLKPLYMEYS
jgi:hypothetical protein